MPVYAFVDSVAESPTVLLDLDDESPLTVVEAPSTNPPTRRVSSSGSSARDGDTIAQAAYNDRQITIPLDFAPKSTADQQAETIQALGRLLDSPCWLMWQHETNSEPVFFRVKYGDMDVNDAIADENPDRGLVLQLVAEPFAYGLPVTGAATIANDPTAATNPMSLTLTDVQGDVATPLRLSWGVTGFTVQRSVCASMASGSSEFPIFTAAFSSAGAPPVTSGWTVTIPSDSAWIGGDKVRAVYASGGLPQRVFTYTFGGPAGDYRVFLRALPGPGVTATIRAEGSPEPVLISAPIAPTANAAWYDMGVVRLPARAPIASNALAEVTGLTSKLYLDIAATAAGTTDLDGLMFVPVGVDSARDSHYATLRSSMAGLSPTGGQVVDGIGQQAYLAIGNTVGQQPTTLAGSFLTVVPGTVNVIHFMKSVYDAGLASTADSITATTTMNYRYFPRYLYVRPATT